MSHLLDSNACIDYLRRGTASRVTQRLLASLPGSVYLCSIVVGELLYGARRSNRTGASLVDVRTFCSLYISLPFDDRAADEYSTIRAHLAASGRMIGANDMLIAAIAVAHNLTVVTHNTADFSRIPGLSLEDWQ